MNLKFPKAAVIAASMILFCGIAAESQTPYRKFAFRDEFNKAKNAPVDASKWTAEIGGGGWGNRELQYYTNEVENAFHDGAGSLVIKAIKKDLPLSFSCWYGQCKYTSARLITKGKFDRKYGRFEARIKIPRGQGMWAAFWMLGDNIEKVGWAACGEIDVMENIGREPSTVYGTVHGPGYSGAGGIGGSHKLPDEQKFADEFHIYAADWTENKIKFYVDGTLYKTITPKDLPAGKQWVYDHPFFMILNLAIGGNWGGAPDDSTQFPQTMLIDYVRVYRR
ncbi:MAG: Beta-glucanase/beta-glucan synthetase [Acidobacteria bacterium]|jgi:beta-glucanase (GH16 family)|nr:Beta-glucanase/beta-glucan synthetase [Acidobacteriota bacterium]